MDVFFEMTEFQRLGYFVPRCSSKARSPGRPGGRLVVAGVAFILPAFCIVVAIGWAYQRFGRLPEITALLHGIKPVVIVIVAQALIGLGRTAVKSVPLALAGGAALVASVIRPLDEVAILAVVGDCFWSS